MLNLEKLKDLGSAATIWDFLIKNSSPEELEKVFQNSKLISCLLRKEQSLFIEFLSFSPKILKKWEIDPLTKILKRRTLYNSALAFVVKEDVFIAGVNALDILKIEKFKKLDDAKNFLDCYLYKHGYYLL